MAACAQKTSALFSCPLDHIPFTDLSFHYFKSSYSLLPFGHVAHWTAAAVASTASMQHRRVSPFNSTARKERGLARLFFFSPCKAPTMQPGRFLRAEDHAVSARPSSSLLLWPWRPRPAALFSLSPSPPSWDPPLEVWQRRKGGGGGGRGGGRLSRWAEKILLLPPRVSSSNFCAFFRRPSLPSFPALLCLFLNE